ncbi:hypothetical protein G7Y89_g1248 [Cudoniella acicularis]|uniref:Uncharacterized protein n=1 Tax=Cudoniella acicularis TaxID=354080 RepID=A0A8H4W9Q1_9HELO|nr:hypothetical protein G7Y89_g1248 [Cudoniella acicularis]
MAQGTIFIRDVCTATEYEIHVHRKSVPIQDVDGDSEAINNSLLRPDDPGLQSKVIYVNGKKKVLLLRTRCFEQSWDANLK